MAATAKKKEEKKDNSILGFTALDAPAINLSKDMTPAELGESLGLYVAEFKDKNEKPYVRLRARNLQQAEETVTGRRVYFDMEIARAGTFVRKDKTVGTYVAIDGPNNS